MNCSRCSSKVTVKEAIKRVKVLSTFKGLYVEIWRWHDKLKRLRQSIHGHSVGRLCSDCLAFELDDAVSGARARHSTYIRRVEIS